MDTYDTEGDGEWVNNSVSRLAQFWSCGMITREGVILTHDHDPQELQRSKMLAAEAAEIMGPTWSFLRSGSDPETQPFYVVAQRGAVVPSCLDESLVRSVFGATLNPEAVVVIEPFVEGANWWQLIEEDAANSAAQHPEWYRVDEILLPWRKLINWFPANRLAHSSFIRINDSGPSFLTLGCVFPNLVVGISDQGSMVGVMTHVVS